MKTIRRLWFVQSALFLLLYLCANADSNLVTAQEKPFKVSSQLKIANIKNSNVVSGCGCYFQSPAESKRQSDKYIFMAEIDEKTAWMNVDGRDVKLRLAGSSQTKSKLKVGSRLYRNYKSGNINVRIDYVVTNVCKPNDVECESTGYDVKITIQKGSQNQTIKAQGYCGC